jgi:hypothetical protein
MSQNVLHPEGPMAVIQAARQARLSGSSILDDFWNSIKHP